MNAFTPAERAALDRVTVPAMRDRLADEIVAATHGATALPQRSPRGGWRRRGRIMVGAGALVVASATAAATGLFERLPIHIPGITRVAEVPALKPKHVVRLEKPHSVVGKLVAPADRPSAQTAVILPTPQQLWRERRAARIAAGLPVRRPLIQRAVAEKIRAMPPAERQAAREEWRRIRALPPAERKLAAARIRADYLARHPRMARRYEQRLEARSAAAADGRSVEAAAPLGRSPSSEERSERHRRWRVLLGRQSWDRR